MNKIGIILKNLRIKLFIYPIIKKYFDKDFYLNEYQDVKDSGIDPFLHYFNFGWKEGRNPSELFDTKYYLDQNKDVKDAGINPLLHYLQYGKKEGRCPVFGSCQTNEVQFKKKYRCKEFSNGIEYLFGDSIANRGYPNVLLVAHLANNNLFGGERSFIDIIEGFSKLKYNILICIPHLYNKNYINFLIKHSVKIATLNYKTWNNFDHIDDNVIRSFELLYKENNISAVHVNTIMLREPLIAAKNCGVKTVTHVREVITHDPDLCQIIGKSPENIIKEVLSNSDYIIANSKRTSNVFGKKEKTFIITNTVDIEKFNVPNEINVKSINIALISSNLPKKGIFDFFELASILEEFTPQAKLILIGPVNEYVKEYEKKQRKGKYKNVEFKGYINDPVEAIKLSNIVLNLSHFQESFGRTILEAMAAGRPVVAYNWGAIPELVHDGENGLLVDFMDVKGIAKCLKKLCNDTQLIREMGQKGKIKAQKCFSKSSYAFNLQSAYRRILKYQSGPSTDLIDFYKWAKISVIIPSYNYESYLTERIESIINQTVKPFEIIFLDDLSEDSSVITAQEILAKSSIPYKIIQNKKNQGIYKQWLKGIELAKGNCIWIAEADDYSDERFLEELIKEFKDPQVVISYCQSKVVDSESNTICMNNLYHTNDLSYNHWLNDYKTVGTRELVDYLFYRNSFPNVSAILFKADHLKASMQGIDQFQYCGDWMLYSKMLFLGKVSYIAESLNNFRRHSVSTTRKNIGNISYLKEILAVKKLQIQNYPIHKNQIQKFENYLNKDYQYNKTGLNSESETYLTFKETIQYTIENNRRFAIVTTNHNSINGGSEMLWIETAKKLRLRGHDVILIIKEWLPEPDIFEELRSFGIEIYFKNGNEYQNLLEFEPDLFVISTGDQDEGTEWFSFCHEKGIKYCIINHLTKDVKHWPIRKEKLDGVKQGYSHAQKVFFTSWNNHGLMQKRLNQKIKNADTFFNPYKIEKNINLPFPDLKDGMKIAMPHRLLIIHKGQDLVIEILSMEKWRKRNIVLNLYGDGPDKSKLEYLTKRYDLNNVFFHPRVSDITTIWKENHIILFSSYMEGQPITLIEAMLCSRVPVVTNVGGHSEVIEDNKSGFIADTPSVKDIDEALERAYQCGNELEIIGKNARKRVLSYLPEESPADNFCNKLIDIV
ncbi:MAG: glycosyltransferase [Bacteroidota bacterium]